MDLPYKFGADDAEMSREDGFNMDIVRDGEKARAEREKMEAAAKRGDDHSDNSDDDDDKKKKKDKKPRKTRKLTEEEKERQKNIVVGPKVDSSGVPTLPVRKAAPKSSSQPPPKTSPKRIRNFLPWNKKKS